jgi:hypothetical protein
LHVQSKPTAALHKKFTQNREITNVNQYDRCWLLGTHVLHMLKNDPPLTDKENFHRSVRQLDLFRLEGRAAAVEMAADPE